MAKTKKHASRNANSIADKARQACKKALRHAADNVMKMIILPLLQWAGESEDGAFFFIVCGNKYVTDIAWSNSEALSTDGGLSIGEDPHASAVFEFIYTAYDFARDESVKNKSFNEVFQAHAVPSKEDNGWCSFETV